MIMKCEGTNIEISVSNPEEASIIHHNLGHKYDFILNNGDVLHKIGYLEDGSYFCGYTVDYFKKYF